MLCNARSMVGDQTNAGSTDGLTGGDCSVAQPEWLLDPAASQILFEASDINITWYAMQGAWCNTDS